MAETLPRAVKVWMGANILQIEFDNGQRRFMRTHFIDNYVSSWSPSKGKGKRVNFFCGTDLGMARCQCPD